MNSKALNAICGTRIVDAILDTGDAGLRFENGTSLAIYNSFIVEGVPAVKATTLIGRCVLKAEEFESEIEITLAGSLVLKVDMRDDAYNGPEAMQLLIPGKPIIVWT